MMDQYLSDNDGYNLASPSPEKITITRQSSAGGSISMYDDSEEEDNGPPKMPCSETNGAPPMKILEELKLNEIKPSEKALKGGFLASLYNSTNGPGLSKITETIPQEHVDIALKILADAGITNYHPVVLQNVAAFAMAKTREYTREAKALANYAGRSKIDESDVKLAIETLDADTKYVLPSRKLMASLAEEKNQTVLSPFKKDFGFHLPSDRFTLMQPTYKLDQNVLSKEISQRERSIQKLHDKAMIMPSSSMSREVDPSSSYTGMAKRARYDDTMEFD
uniref:Transcription initiation factor TFIID subunit 8 n=1 Tax=Rhabditophanes sp. KR3021 TaxID=114890 RepID=A0AC35TSR5_9BILA